MSENEISEDTLAQQVQFPQNFAELGLSSCFFFFFSFSCLSLFFCDGKNVEIQFSLYVRKNFIINMRRAAAVVL